jgi:hypothetical protein
MRHDGYSGPPGPAAGLGRGGRAGASPSRRHASAPGATSHQSFPAPPPFPGRHTSRSRATAVPRPPRQPLPAPRQRIPAATPAVPGATSRSRCHQPFPVPPAVPGATSRPRRHQRFPGAAGGSRAPPAVPGRHTSRSPRHRCSLAATPAVPRCRQRFPSAASGSPAPPAVPQRRQRFPCAASGSRCHQQFPGATSGSRCHQQFPGAASGSPVPPAVPRCRQRFPVPRQPFPRHRHSRRHASPSPRRQRFPAPRQPRPAPGIAAPWCELSKLVV